MGSMLEKITLYDILGKRSIASTLRLWKYKLKLNVMGKQI